MRPPSSAAALSRYATRIDGFGTSPELRPYLLIASGTPRRSSREYAQTEHHARQLAAERLGVPVESVMVRPEPYSLTVEEG
jgi:hypothetical protein